MQRQIGYIVRCGRWTQSEGGTYSPSTGSDGPLRGERPKTAPLRRNCKRPNDAPNAVELLAGRLLDLAGK